MPLGKVAYRGLARYFLGAANARATPIGPEQRSS